MISSSIALVSFLGLIAFGLPIPFAFLLVGTAAFFLTAGTNALGIMSRILFDQANNYTLLCLPLFVLMGQLIAQSGLSSQIYGSLEKWLSKIPGGLYLANIVGCTAFSASVGVSTATAATMAPVSLPRMKERGYDVAIGCGSLAGGSLGLLIPPSAGFIVYGVLTENSIGRLFLAGVMPGLLMEALFFLYVMLRVLRNPKLAPAYSGATWRERFVSLKELWPFPVIIMGVLGTIFLGIATPAEAAAVGAAVVVILTFVYRKFSWTMLRDGLIASARTTSWIMLILASGVIFSNFLVRQGFGHVLRESIQNLGLPPLVLIVFMIVIYVFLGMFLDGMSILVITVPIFYPIATSTGFDPIWLGVFIIATIELGLITPPVGLVCYIIAGIAKSYGITLEQVFQGSFGFAIMMIIGLILISIFPQIVLWLPGMM